MHEFTGKLMKGRGVVYKAVKGEYEVDEYDPAKSWSGKFQVTSGEVPFIEDDGDLFLDNGWHGPIRICRVRQSTETVEFKGVGQLKEGKASSYA